MNLKEVSRQKMVKAKASSAKVTRAQAREKRGQTWVPLVKEKEARLPLNATAMRDTHVIHRMESVKKSQ